MISQAELYESLASPFQSLKLYQQVLKLTNGRAGHPSGIAMASMGYLFWEWQNLEVARKYLLQAWNMGQEIRSSNVIFNSGFWLALLSQAQGHTHEADSWLQRLDTHMQEAEVFDGTEMVNAFRALFALEQGRLEDALLWVQRRPGFSEDETFLHEDTEDCILVRILLAAGRTYGEAPYLHRAQVLLEHLRKSAEAIGKKKLLIEVLALQALLLQQRGDIAGALTLLEQALVLAEPGRYIRVFVDKGDAMAMLLRQIRDQYKTRKAGNPRLNLAYVRKLLTSFMPPATHSELPIPLLQLPVEDVPLLEQLSWREQEVLRLMAAGRKNQEIARELVIVTGTVKSHTNSIYRKLAVNSRVQAIARARALHLL
jgi:LuxR family maltose regulon positive regulatory protein